MLESAKVKTELDFQEVKMPLNSDERFEKIPLTMKRITRTNEMNLERC